MKTYSLKEGALAGNSFGLGTVTRKVVRESAVELGGQEERALPGLFQGQIGARMSVKLI